MSFKNKTESYNYLHKISTGLWNIPVLINIKKLTNYCE